MAEAETADMAESANFLRLTYFFIPSESCTLVEQKTRACVYFAVIGPRTICQGISIGVSIFRPSEFGAKSACHSSKRVTAVSAVHVHYLMALQLEFHNMI